MTTHEQPFMVFIGVTTGSSAALRMFPAWARLLGQPQMTLRGLDLPLDASVERYRAAVQALRDQPQARGALVTSHKLNLMRAAGDLFDEVSIDAQYAQEISCIYKRGERLLAHAIDPESTHRALQTMLGAGYWSRRSAHLLCLGAGGTAAALLTGLCTRRSQADLPQRILFVDRSPERLDRLLALSGRLPPATAQVDFLHHTQPEENDRLVGDLPPGSLVVNATGMGKDLPGSPLTGAAVFPEDGLAWDLNYRGELDFLSQARAQASRRNLRVVDGWELFLLGWALVCGAVFDVNPFGLVYEQLVDAARIAR